MSLGRKIELARREAGLTQKDLAESIGRDQSVISLYEKGKAQPGPKAMKAIAEVTDKPVPWFFEEEPAGQLLSQIKIEEEFIRKRTQANQVVSFEEAFRDDLPVPVKVMDLQVGAGITLNDDAQYAVEQMPSRLARGATHLLTVRGKSMEPEIEDGDRLWVSIIPAYGRPAPGKLVVANLVGDGIKVSHVFYQENLIGLGKKNSQVRWYQEEEIRLVGIVLKIEKSEESILRMEEKALRG